MQTVICVCVCQHLFCCLCCCCLQSHAMLHCKDYRDKWHKSHRQKNMPVSMVTHTQRIKSASKWEKYFYGNEPGRHTHTHTHAGSGTLVAVMHHENHSHFKVNNITVTIKRLFHVKLSWQLHPCTCINVHCYSYTACTVHTVCMQENYSVPLHATLSLDCYCPGCFIDSTVQ